MTNSIVEYICIMATIIGMFIMGGVIATIDLKTKMRTEMIQKDMGSWVIDAKTGQKHFNSPIEILK